MSNDQTPQVPATRDRREAVREKAQQVHAKQSRLRLLRGILLSAAGLAVAGVATAAIIWAFAEMGPRPVIQPANAQNDGFAVTTVTGAADPVAGGVDEAATPAPAEAAPTEAAPTPTPTASETPAVDIRVYVDYLAPEAREFQLANADQLKKWVSQDAATLSYYPVAMLTSKSNGTKYSLRAAGAAACVATYSPDTFFAFNDELLRQQPEIDSDGLNDEQLAELAQASGAASPKIVRNCIEDGSFSTWARAATDRALESIPDTDGAALSSTLMILVNGTQYVGAMDDPKEFAQFVLTAASDSYYRTPSPTPSASVTPTPAP